MHPGWDVVMHGRAALATVLLLLGGGCIGLGVLLVISIDGIGSRGLGTTTTAINGCIDSGIDGDDKKHSEPEFPSAT